MMCAFDDGNRIDLHVSEVFDCGDQILLLAVQKLGCENNPACFPN